MVIAHSGSPAFRRPSAHVAKSSGRRNGLSLLKTPKKSWSFSGIQSFEQGHPNLGSLYSGCACYFLSGSTIVFDEPSGAACMPGAVSPCGLEAGAPPDLVLIGPVQPCGCN